MQKRLTQAVERKDLQLKSMPIDFELVDPPDPRPKPSAALLAPTLLARGAVRRSRRNRGRKRGARRPAMAPALPPPLEASPTYYARFRFMANASAAGYAITVLNMAGIFGVVTTSANTTHPVVSSFKIKRVTIWSPTTTGAVQCEWVWNMSASGHDKDSQKITSVPTGVTLTRPLVTVPPVNSIAAFWTNFNTSGSSSVAAVTAQSGAVIDIEADFTLSTGLGQFGTITTTAAGTVGVFNYLPLDGTTGKLLPAGRPFIV